MKSNRLLLAIFVFGIAISFISLNPSLASVSVEPDGYFELYIYQGNHAAVGEVGLMGFDISSFFNVSMDVNISMIINTPSQQLITIYSGPALIPAWETFYDQASLTFTEIGSYKVSLYVFDQYGREWKADCWWDVSDPWLDLWINQDNYASVGDTGHMAPDIYSHFSSNLTVSVKLVIIAPNGTEYLLYDNPSVLLEVFAYWSTDVYYYFSEAGYYNVIFSVSNGEEYWDSHCWWQVYNEQEYLALWIYQDNYRNINEYGWMDFNVENRFSSNRTLSILILLIGPTSEVQLLNETVMLEPGTNWYHYTEYYFSEPGYYDVALLVTDHSTSNVWEFWCWWEIGDGPMGGYDLFIDQENTAKVGETKWMHFKAQSNFNHDMPNVIIKIRMEDPTGYTVLLLEINVPINAHGIWEIDLNYTFTQTGDYIVHFELYDDIMSEWYTNCKWTVSEAGPSIYVDGPSSVDINETFTIVGKVYSGINDELHIKTVTLAWENGTVIETVNVSLTISPDSYHHVYFNVTLPYSGEFTFRITADTSKGILETKHTVKVGIIDDESDPENKDTTPTLTPGFESIFGLLGLILAIPLIRKSRR
ncbi:MAG: PGF-CTERM sorting domain-containing protein [Candidatus Hodarchaeales archaeon]|jgi:hypothetical protein